MKTMNDSANDADTDEVYNDEDDVDDNHRTLFMVRVLVHNHCMADSTTAVGCQSYLAVWLGTAGKLTVPVGSKLHGLGHVVLILFRG